MPVKCELLARAAFMHHADKGHDALKHYPAVKGLIDAPLAGVLSEDLSCTDLCLKFYQVFLIIYLFISLSCVLYLLHNQM